METKIEISEEGILAYRKDNELLAIVVNDLTKRTRIFYSVNEMSLDDIKELLQKHENKTS